MTKDPAWAYSSIKMFAECPKKYFHIREVKDFKIEQGPEAKYGEALHKAAELYILNGTPIPQQFAFMYPILDSLNKIPGDKYCELRLGIKKENDVYYTCGFFDKDVWLRTISDLVVVNNTIAYSIDYKTGKNSKYADMRQLDVVAGALFVKFPQLESIKSGLIYVNTNEFMHKEHTFKLRDTYLATFRSELDRLQVAKESGVWNARSSPLCGWCPVTSCPHHIDRGLSHAIRK